MRVLQHLKENVRESGAVHLYLNREADLVKKMREASLKVVMHEYQEAPHGLRLP